MIERVREASFRSIWYSPHALKRMDKENPPISKAEIREVIANGEVIEDYPEDVRGHSCLIAGETSEGRTVHICCAPKEDYLAIITAYVPDPDKWDSTGRRRRKSR